MDKALKQRLVGATVLIAFAVVVLPMLVGGQGDKSQESRRIDLPPKPQELAFETRRFPIGDQDSSQPSVLEPVTQPSLQHDAAVSVAQPAGAAPDDEENAGEEELDTVQTASESQVGDASLFGAGVGDAGRYLVQVASFSSTDNANRLAGRLREAGMPVLMDTIQATAGRLHRVRIGPYAERTEADRAIGELNARFPDLSPRVFDLRPQESAPVAEASDPLIRWVVQVGSFSADDNADSLVFQLRDSGYRARSVPVTGASGTAYKVWVGPVIERQEAEALATSIRNELGLEGLVMSAD